VRHHRQREEQGEGDEGREAHHLPEHRQLPCPLVGETHEHRLVHLPQHVRHQRRPLRAPLVSLVVVARAHPAVVAPQQQVHHVRVQLREDRREHDPEAEGEESFERKEECFVEDGGWSVVGEERRPPGTKVPHQPRIHRDIHQILRRQGPVAEAQRRHRHADEARREGGRHAALRYLLDLHLLREPGRLGDAEAGEHEPQEHIPAQGDERRLVVVVGDQRRRQPQDHVEQRSRHDVKPEHGVVVLMARLPQVDQPRLEATRLQLVGNHGKHGQHRRHTVVRRVEQPSQHDAEDQSEQLLHPVVHPAPEEPLRRLLLQ